MERAPSGFCLMLRTPPGTPATHVRPRPGHEHGPGTTPSISIEPPINVFTPMRTTSRRKPVRSSPRPRHPDGTSSDFGFPPSSAPRRPRAGQRTPGWGQAIEHGPETTLYGISQASNPACSLNACDLTSHGEYQGTRNLRRETRACGAAGISPEGTVRAQRQIRSGLRREPP